MWEPEGPYSSEELRQMRRLIVASGAEIDAWVQRTRRSAEFIRSVSAEQADVITAQAIAVAADPGDFGSEIELDEARAHFAAVEAAERHKHLWRLLLEFRRRHYPSSE